MHQLACGTVYLLLNSPCLTPTILIRNACAILDCVLFILSVNYREDASPSRLSLKLVDKAVISGLYTLSAGISYFLMLMVMTYNGGVFIAVVVGLGMGYFFFGFDRAAVANQAMSDTCCV